MKHLAAWTQQSFPFPPFVSIREMDGKVELIVREKPRLREVCGATISVEMTREEFDALLAEALASRVQDSMPIIPQARPRRRA